MQTSILQVNKAKKRVCLLDILYIYTASSHELTRNGSSARQATSMDLNNVDNVQSSDGATLHQQYDGYGDGNACF